MFDKLKNIKFSFKKKSKEESTADSSLDDDIFSASDSEGGEDFFSEPSFGAEGIEGGDEPPAVPGDISLTDSSDDEISTPDSFGASSTVFSEDDLLKSSKVVKGGSTRRTLLLFVLFLVFAGYAAYAYILPQFYPDLLAELLGEPPKKQVVVKKEAPKRVAVKKTVPAKPVPAKPAPAKPIQEAPKAKVPPKPTEEKPAEKVAAPATKTPEESKPAVTKAAPQPVEAKAPSKEGGDALELVEKETPPKPVAVKKEVKAVPPATAKPVEPAKREVTKKEPEVPAQKVSAPVQPAVVPSKKARKDIKISQGTVPASARGYYVQEGVYIFKGNLKAPKKKIASLGYTPLVKQGRKVIKMNRLIVGEWGDFLIAEDLVKKLRKNGFSAELISKNERFSALIGSFYYKHMAENKKGLLRKKGFDARIEKTPINMKVHHLLVGPFNTPEEADTVLDSLKGKGLTAVILQKR